MEIGSARTATWTRAGRAAALVAGALVCLMVGLLAGVMAAGGKPADVLTVLRTPATPAAATASVRRRPHTVTVTATAPAAAPVTRIRTETVTTPASTVTVTSTVTAPTTSPTTTPTTTQPTP